MTKTTRADRKRANILITGVPCTGKTSLVKRVLAHLANDSGADAHVHYIDVNEAITEERLHDGYDDEYKSFILNEDRLLDHLEVCNCKYFSFFVCIYAFQQFFDDSHVDGGLIIDYHSSEFFPERWFDYVVVLRCDNTAHFDRLHARANYSQRKRDENLECEIMGVVAEEAHEAYSQEGVVHELQNSDETQLEQNAKFVCGLISKYKT